MEEILDYISSGEDANHATRAVGVGGDAGRKLSSVASGSMSDMSEISGMTGHPRTSVGPYLEGNMKLLGNIECSNDVMCCRFNDSGKILAVGLIDGSIKIYETDPLTCNCLHSLQDDDTVTKHLPVTQIRFKAHNPDEKVEYSHILVASYASGMVKFWHYTSGKCLHTLNDPENSQVLTIGISPSGTQMVTTGDDPRLHVYDMKTLQRINTMEPSDGRDIMDGHRGRVFALQYHPRAEHELLSGGWDNTVQYWDDRMKHSVRRISGPHICGDAIDIDPKHDHILTGSWRTDTSLQIWDYRSARKIKDVPPEPMNSSLVYCCQWLGTDSIICGGTNQNMARIIDRGTLNTVGQLLDLHQSVYCIDNDHHGHHPKVAIGSNKYIYIVKEEKKPTS